MPQFDCYNHISTRWEICEQKDFCGTNARWRYNYDAATSLHNWVEKLDLACQPTEHIGSIGSAYFIGCLVSVVVATRLADVYGRKRPMLLSQVLQTLPVLAFFIIDTYWQAAILFFIYGLGFGGTVAVGAIYVQEFMMKKHRALTIGMFGIFDGAAVAIIVFYFYFITKFWEPWYYMCLAIQVWVILGLLWLPESPDFLYAKGRYDESKEVLLRMAKFNNSKINEE